MRNPREPTPGAGYGVAGYGVAGDGVAGNGVAGAGRYPRRTRQPEPGLPGWAAVLVLLAIAAIGSGIDGLTGSSVQLAFNWGIVLAAGVAILLVRRSAMFWVVVAPPLVYVVISAVTLFFSHGELRKNVYNAAANWLVYGFPAIAGATAVVLIVAGVRIIKGR